MGGSGVVRRKLSKLVDVTIAYPDGKPLNLFSIATGWDPPCVTHVHYRVFDVAEVSHVYGGHGLAGIASRFIMKFF